MVADTSGGILPIRLVVTYSCSYTTQIAYAESSYYRVPPAPSDMADERLNPKFWAKWFREFLAEICGGDEEEDVIHYIESAAVSLLRRTLQFCRSGTLQVREWKWKNWCQAMEAA